MVISLKKISKEEYKKITDIKTPPGKNFINYFWAFFVGGIVCALAEGLKIFFEYLNLEEDIIKMAIPCSVIFIAFLLTIFKVFHKIAKKAGAGVLVPISGFANAVISPAMEFKTEGFILGVGANIFKIAGAVITYGITAGVIYGFIYWITTLIK